MGTISADGAKVNVTDCDREPIHIPGAIQPHGVLLALDPADMTIVQVAGDTETLLSTTPQALLGQSFEARLGPAAMVRLGGVLDRESVLPHPLFVFETRIENAPAPLDAIVHISEGTIIVELETQRDAGEDDPLALVQQMISRVAAADSLASCADAAVTETRKATGFDRVMLYRFLSDDSGSVIAEDKADCMEPYLGLRYPASDIPKQARALYLTNWLRLIPDAGYSPAPIMPALNPKTGKPLDLSHSVLRSVSPVHLKYLANMGVAASMSMSIVIQGRLWGLIACHHRTPHFLNTRRRAACELFAQMLSLQLQTKLESEVSAQRIQAGEIRRELVAHLPRDDFAEALIFSRPNLMDLIPAQGCVVFVDGTVSSTGRVPPTERLLRLIRWLDAQQSDGIYATNSLASVFPEAAAYCDMASGVLALSVSRSPKDYVLWFRPELRQIVRWAGNPAKSVEPGSQGLALSPRASFAAWEQTVSMQSEPWSDGDLESAATLRTSILEVVLHRLDWAMRDRQLAETRQQLLMAELDHRVKNTIAVVQSLVSLSSKSARSLTEFTDGLHDRLIAMARVQNLLTQTRWEGIPLRTLIEQEAAVFQDGSEDCCEIVGDPVVLAPRAAAALSMALHELATNAGKYGALSTAAGWVRVQWQVAPSAAELVLTWAETGGPPVSPPTQRGFGRTLLERSVAHDLGGTVTLNFEPSGVTCHVTIPLTQIISRTSIGPLEQPAAKETADPSTFSGCRILLIEDSGLVALTVQAMLEDADIQIVGPIGNLRDAVRAAMETPFDAAILDVDLAGNPVWPVADALHKRGLPFVFTTGYQEAVVPQRFSGRPVLLKPYRSADLIAVLSELCCLTKAS
ncbi:MAG TPA: HWE histidine kinase domain-containing protein [Aliidongia sp.]|nr:HWE histidine kinase domain-containing protein [Aliidongia sp.]